MEYDNVMEEVAPEPHEMSKTVSEEDIVMSTEIEQKPIIFKNEEEKVEISQNCLDSNTKTGSSAELTFHKTKRYHKKVTFKEPIIPCKFRPFKSAVN